MNNVITKVLELSFKQAGSTLASVDWKTDLILDSAAAGQLVAIRDGDYDGWFKEKGIPSLKREEKNITHK